MYSHYTFPGLRISSPFPYYLQCPEATPFVLAGLWERNEHLDMESLETFCILTKSASTAVDGIHHRMPVRLSCDAHADWLDSTVSDVKLLTELMASADNDWSFYPVSRHVNSPQNNSSRCLKPKLCAIFRATLCTPRHRPPLRCPRPPEHRGNRRADRLGAP